MRRADREITDRAELRRILDEAQVVRLAMSDENRPYVVPLTFALDGEDIVLHSARVGQKIAILRRNPAVCFEVEERVEVKVGPSPCETGMRFRSVIGRGVVEFVEDAAERARMLALFGSRYGAPNRPLPVSEVERTAVLRIRVSELTGKCGPG
jgi:nitroimidazol reductase NimA-like FMN-containing flavoprotein (pyridoxamine 5'-phosphate oxidase superfamily)